MFFICTIQYLHDAADAGKLAKALYLWLFRRRCMVLRLPRISIISATPGPSFRPLRMPRSVFINCLYFNWCASACVFSRSLSGSRWKSTASSNRASRSSSTAFFRLCWPFFGSTHRKCMSLRTRSLRVCIRLVDQCKMLRMCSGLRSSLCLLKDRYLR